MAHEFSADVEASLKQQMATGRYASLDDLLRRALDAVADEDEDLDAVREAIAELRAGDPGVPLDEAFRVARQNT
jgi:Arc/MetJ-type ribon-helix-helix transcriptional regulator